MIEPAVPPAVSVVTPAYNASRSLGRALESVRRQTLTNLEIIVVNDGSPDTPALRQVLAPFAGTVRYLEQENRGAAAARNTAIAAARGEWLAFLDADDWWDPSYLDEQLAVLRARPELDLVYCDARLFGDASLAGRTFMETAPSCEPVSVERLVSFACNVITSGVVVRKQSVVDAGGFDEALRRGHDFNLWVRLAAHGARLGCHRAVLVNRQIDVHALSGDAVAQHERAIAALQRTVGTVALSEIERAAADASLVRLRADLAMERGRVCLRAHDWRSAAQYIGEANQVRWRWKRAAVLYGLRMVIPFVRAVRVKALRG